MGPLLLVEAQPVLVGVPLHKPQEAIPLHVCPARESEKAGRGERSAREWGGPLLQGGCLLLRWGNPPHDVLGLDPRGLAVHKLGLDVHGGQGALVVDHVEAGDVAQVPRGVEDARRVEDERGGSGAPGLGAGELDLGDAGLIDALQGKGLVRSAVHTFGRKMGGGPRSCLDELEGGHTSNHAGGHGGAQGGDHRARGDADAHDCIGRSHGFRWERPTGAIRPHPPA